MSVLKQIFEYNLEMIAFLEENVEIDRDEKIAAIDLFLDKRGEILQSVKPPFAKEEEHYVQEIQDQNKQLDLLFNAEKTLIQKDIKELSDKKKSSNKYSNPYENLSTDGIFYDKRK